MLLSNVDMTNVQEQGTSMLLPEGQYNVKISDLESKKAQSGKPMVKLTLEVLDGEYSGVKIYDNIVFHEKIMGRVKHFLHMIGEPYEGVITVNTDNWFNKRLRIMNAHQRYEGRTRNQVKALFEYNEQVPSVSKEMPKDSSEQSMNAEDLPF